jgi:hypothetical protein
VRIQFTSNFTLNTQVVEVPRAERRRAGCASTCEPIAAARVTVAGHVLNKAISVAGEQECLLLEEPTSGPWHVGPRADCARGYAA